MGQAMVVKTQLTPQLIAEGAALLAKLDAEGMAPEVAVWLYCAEKGYWKLLLADKRVGTEGPLKLIRATRKALEALRTDATELSVFDTLVTKPDRDVLKLLRKTVRVPRGTKGFRLGPHITIDDAYIYRLKGARRRVA